MDEKNENKNKCPLSRNRIKQDIEKWFYNESKAIEFLKIEDPFSYRCKSSSITANDFLEIYGDLANPSFIGDLEKLLIVYARAPPRIYEMYKNSMIKEMQREWNLSDHTKECNECEKFQDLFINYIFVLNRYRNNLNSLLNKPFGLSAWITSVAFLQKSGYKTFEGYLIGQKKFSD